MRTLDPLAGKGYELWLLYPHPLVVQLLYYLYCGSVCYTYEVYTHIRHLYSPRADLQLLNPVCYGPPNYNNTSSKLWPWIGAPVGLLMIYIGGAGLMNIHGDPSCDIWQETRFLV